MYAVIETGGKQYRVELGNEIEVERLDVEAGKTIQLERVLLVSDGDDTTIGRPIVEGALVSADVLRQDRGEKLIVFKYGPKTRRRVKNGHRQELTVLRIADIAFGGRSAAKEYEEQAAEREAARKAAAEEAAKKAAADKALAAKLAAEAAPAEPGGKATAGTPSRRGKGPATTTGKAATDKAATGKAASEKKPATGRSAGSRTQAGEAGAAKKPAPRKRPTKKDE
jgi:large subunit ribosomal protein L21